MLFGSGVDRRGEVLDLGVQLGLVAKSGAWFSLNELALPAEGEGAEGPEGGGEAREEAARALEAVGEWPLMMGQGREKVRALTVLSCCGCPGHRSLTPSISCAEQGVPGGAPGRLQGADDGGAGQAQDHGGACVPVWGVLWSLDRG